LKLKPLENYYTSSFRPKTDCRFPDLILNNSFAKDNDMPSGGFGGFEAA
jgi:hypothetical protein